MKRFALLGAAMFIGCGGGETEAPSGCDASAAEGVAVASTDPYGGQPYALGYPPYAIDGCSLVYVSEAGDLELRDLASGGEVVIAPAAEAPRRPAIAGDVLAWEAEEGGVTVVRVRASGVVKTIAGTFDHATEPRAAADAVIFTAWLGPGATDDTDVMLYVPSTGAISLLAGGPGQQRFGDVSATHAAWTDFSEDPDGTFGENASDIADLVVFDRATAQSTVRKREGKQAFPLLGADGFLAYLDWNAVHPEPKFSAYGLRVGPVDSDGGDDQDAAPVTTLLPYVRPIARDALIEWVGVPSGGGQVTLFRRAVDLGAPAEEIAPIDGGAVFGPSASAKITLVGASDGSAVKLRAFAR